MLAGVSGAGIMVDSSVELSATAPASSSAAAAAGTLEQPLLRRSLSSEYFAGKGAVKVACCSIVSYSVTVRGAT